jgi:phosphosulfolactate synthase
MHKIISGVMKMTIGWEDILEPPLKGRLSKPRSSGITMLIDKGLSVNGTTDLLDLNGPFIDFIKLSFGTAALYRPETLKQKIALAKDFTVNIYPGGTFFEIAHWQKKTSLYLEKIAELGFEWVEISDGSIEISPVERIAWIHQAGSMGLKVITEVGKKNALQQPEENQLIETALTDLENGAWWVIIEARESGQGIGIFDGKGEIIPAKLASFSRELPLDKLIWEAPQKKQQAKLINEFGPNVNLGNIPTTEIMALEALRLGYRNDTWKI